MFEIHPIQTTALLFLALSVGGWAQALNLQEVCRRALEVQPRMQIQQARVERSQASEAEAWTAWNPRLSLDANYTYTTPNAVLQQGNQTVVFSNNNNYLVTLRLTQMLWNGGFYSSQAEARRCQVVLQQERLREARLQLEEEAALAFLEVKLAEENLRLSQQQVVQRQAQLEQSQKLFARGTVPRYDAIRGEAELARARQEVLDAERLLQLRRNTLQSLIQMPLSALEDLQDPKAPTLPADLWAEATGRPDLRIAELAQQESQARLEAARREDSPTLSLQTDVQNRNTTVAFPGTQWNTGFVLSWPIFDQGISQTRADQMLAELKELEAQAREVERLARLQVEQLRTDVETRFRAWQATAVQCQAAEEAERVAQLRYDNGLSTQAERLDAELNLQRARRDRIAARYDLAQAEIRLNRALGHSQLEEPGPPEAPKG